MKQYLQHKQDKETSQKAQLFLGCLNYAQEMWLIPFKQSPLVEKNIYTYKILIFITTHEYYYSYIILIYKILP